MVSRNMRSFSRTLDVVTRILDAVFQTLDLDWDDPDVFLQRMEVNTT